MARSPGWFLAALALFFLFEPATGGNPKGRTDAHSDPLPPGALARLGTTRLRHHGLCAVAFSADGKTLASAGTDRTVRLWDAATGQLLRQAPLPRGQVRALVCRGEQILVCTTTGVGGTLHLTDALTGKELWMAAGDWNELRDVALSPDGKFLASGNGPLHLWETATRKKIASFPGKMHDLDALALAPDGHTLASRQWDVLRVWDASGARRWEVAAPRDIPQTTHRPGTVAFSPDGKRLAGQVRRDRIHVWDAATGKELLTLDEEYSSGRLLFSPDGKTLAVAGEWSVRLWDTAGKRRAELGAGRETVGCLAFAPDGKTLAVGAGDTLHLWDLGTGKERFVLAGHPNGVSCVAFSPDGKALASGGKGGVRLWDASDWKERRQFRGNAQGLTCLVFSPDSDVLSWGGPGQSFRTDLRHDKGQVTWLCGSDVLEASSPDGLVRARWLGPNVWVSEEKQGKTRFRLDLRRGDVVAAAFSPDGKLLAVGDSRGTIGIWETVGGRKLREQRTRANVGVGVAFSADGRTLASWEFDGKDDRVERVRTRRATRELMVGRLNPANANPIRLWEVASGKERGRCGGQPDELWSAAFSADGTSVASAGKGGGVRVWDAVTGKLLRHLPGHRGEVLSVSFAPDGKTLASGSYDTTVLVWDISGLQRGQAPAPLKSGEEDSLWADLASADAALAYRALWALAAAPARTVPLLRRHLQPVPSAASPQVARLLADLDHQRFAVRDRAMAELAKLEEGALPALRQRLEAPLTLEARRRVEQLLNRLDFAAPSVEQLRQFRAVEVLEHVGTGAARQVLQTVAGGAPEARLTQDARAALGRLRSLR